MTSLRETFPEIAAEADGWDPSTVAPKSNKKLPFRCGAGHCYEMIVANRTRKGYGCPYCAGRYPVAGVNDLATSHPELAAQAVGWEPTSVLAGSGSSLLWRCEVGHEWEAVVASRALNGAGCPYCSGRYPIIGQTDLATSHPALAAQAHGWDPTTVKAGTAKKVEWCCARGHLWRATVSSRASRGTGCPVCANKSVLAGFNDLATTHPTLAAQAWQWDPTSVLAGTHASRQWRCARGHIWVASVANRAFGGRGCPVCANKVILAGFNDLATTDPDIAAQADGWDPTTCTRSSSAVCQWRCTKGHAWHVSPNGRTSKGGTDCPVCAGRVVLTGFNDLATTHPDLAAQAVGWDPTTVTRGSDKRRRWCCPSGHTWMAAVSNRVGGRGCPTCAPSGFDPERPAWLYLYRHEGRGLLQVGITNAPKSRLRKHERAGWLRLDVMGPFSGTWVHEAESQVKRFLAKEGIRYEPDQESQKFDGYTECWATDDMPVSSLQELLIVTSSP